MRIRAHQRIGVGKGASVPRRGVHHATQVFQVHLVADAGIRRHDLEVLECLLAPAQEGVALDIALELELSVEGKGIRGTELVHLHRVVNHQLRRQERVDLLRVATHAPHSLAHRGQVHHRGHPGEVLKQHARGHECDFFLRCRVGLPLRQRLNIFWVNEAAVFVPQEVFEQHLEREGKPRNRANPVSLEGVEAENLILLRANRQGCLRAECIDCRGAHLGGYPFLLVVEPVMITHSCLSLECGGLRRAGGREAKRKSKKIKGKRRGTPRLFL